MTGTSFTAPNPGAKSVSVEYRCHRTTEQGMAEAGWTSGSHLPQPPSQAWPAIASFPGLYSDVF